MRSRCMLRLFSSQSYQLFLPKVDDEVEVYAQIILQPVVPAAQNRQLSRAQATVLPIHGYIGIHYSPLIFS